MTDIEVPESRANALLKEAAISEAEQRSAMVTLADRALIATGWSEAAEASGSWDEQAAKAMLCDALERAGVLPYDRVMPAARIGMDTYVSYRRPGQ